MHYRRLGKSGIKVSEISLGAWVTFGAQIDEPASLEIIHMAYEQGINYFDFADVYAEGRAEEIMGKALADLPREGVARVLHHRPVAALRQKGTTEGSR